MVAAIFTHVHHRYPKPHKRLEDRESCKRWFSLGRETLTVVSTAFLLLLVLYIAKMIKYSISLKNKEEKGKTLRIDDPVYIDICKLYANTHHYFFYIPGCSPWDKNQWKTGFLLKENRNLSIFRKIKHIKLFFYFKKKSVTFSGSIFYLRRIEAFQSQR